MNGRMKHIKRTLFKFVMVFSLTAALACTVPLGASAEKNDIYSLSLDCVYGGKALSDMSFRLYRVADISGTSSFILSGDFSRYQVNLNLLDTTDWKDAANTLATYIKPDSISAIETRTTDSSGHMDVDSLTSGLYLVVGDSMEDGDIIYSSTPFLVALPSLQEDGSLAYSVIASPKVSATTVTSSDDTDKYVDITVIKVWNDGDAETRPESIDVTLLRNGSPYVTYTLDKDNYWRHIWTGLSRICDWTVIENNVPAGYTVSYTASNTKLTITNSFEETGTTDGDGTNIQNNPDYSASGADGESVGSAENPDFSASGEGSSIGNSEETLPQTGVLWWPVTMMAGAGTALFGLGWWIYFGRQRKNDEK